MKKIFLTLWCLLLSFGTAAGELNYQDDFNSLDRDFWLVWNHGGGSGPYSEDYTLAQVSNGIVSLPVNTTDHGPELITKAIPITTNSVVTASWRSKVHYANEYFAGLTAFALVDYSGNYDPDKGDSIRPFAFWNEATQKEAYYILASAYYRNYVYNNYDPPIGGNSFGFCANGEDCFVTTPKWDQFVEYKVVLDFKNNEAKFWQDGEYVGSSPMRDDVDLSKFKYLKIWFSPYGWWTGHEMQLDWFKLSVTDQDTTTTTDCTPCLPELKSDYSLHLPVVTIGDSAYYLDFALGSITPQVTFNLSGYGPPQCQDAALAQCANCLPSFDLTTSTLHIPFFQIGDTAYSFDLSLKSVLPVVSIKLDSYGIGMCDVVTTGNSASGGQTSCSDCSCSDYASSHPDLCGRTSNLNFRITWHDTNDVDLHVEYSGNGGTEEIYYSEDTGTITGGTLDVDANGACTDTTTSPVENIVYDNPPPGVYTVKVCGFESCSGGPATSQVLVQTLVNGQVTKEETVAISNWDDSCITVFTHSVEGSSAQNSGSSSQTMSGVLDTTGEWMVSFVRNEFSSSYISDYDLGLEHWCIDGVALCGNFVEIGNVALSSSITPPASGYLSDEAGYEECTEIDPTKTYVNKNRDGSYTAFKITSHTKLGSCDHKIEFDYINLQ